MRADWKLDADEGMRKLEQYASWVQREWPSAAASLREGLSELFTVNRLGLPKPLRRCLTTTNIIEAIASPRNYLSINRLQMRMRRLPMFGPTLAPSRLYALAYSLGCRGRAAMWSL